MLINTVPSDNCRSIAFIRMKFRALVFTTTINVTSETYRTHELYAANEGYALRLRSEAFTRNHKNKLKSIRPYSVSQKNPLWGYLTFCSVFSQTVDNFWFFMHILYVPMYTRLQIFIQLSPTLTKLWHIERDYLVHIICSKCPPPAGKERVQSQTFA